MTSGTGDDQQLKLFTLWSNFIYFIAGAYALLISYFEYKLNKVTSKLSLFLVYGLLLILTGSFSISYHLHTPSWTGNYNTVNTKRFEKNLELDKGFAVGIMVYSLLIFLFRIWICKIWFIYDSNFYFAFLFGLLGFIFFGIANKHFEETGECKKRKLCVHTHLDSYDIFHSNWHIFTSISLIFWISLIYNSYKN